MYSDISTIALRLPYGEVFEIYDQHMVECLGTLPLLYAAIAHFVFDDSFYAEDIINRHDLLMDDFLSWIERFYSRNEHLIEHLRLYYDRTKEQPSPTLLRIQYTRVDEDLYITAGNDYHVSDLGGQWRFLAPTS